jgi:hypothetical protein
MTFDEYNTDENFDKKESSLDELVKLGLEEGKSSDEIKSSLSPKWQKSKKIGEFDNYVTKYSKPKEEPKAEEVKETVTEETAPKVEPLKEATSNLDVETKDFADKNNAISFNAEDEEYKRQEEELGKRWSARQKNIDKMAESMRSINDRMVEQIPTFATKRFIDGEFGDPKSTDAKLRLAHFLVNGVASKLRQASNIAMRTAGKAPMFDDTTSDYEKYQQSNFAKGMENRWKKYEAETQNAIDLAKQGGMSEETLTDSIATISSNNRLQSAFNQMNERQKVFALKVLGEIGGKLGNMNDEEFVNTLFGMSAMGQDLDYKEAAGMIVYRFVKDPEKRKELLSGLGFVNGNGIGGLLGGGNNGNEKVSLSDGTEVTDPKKVMSSSEKAELEEKAASLIADYKSGKITKEQFEKTYGDLYNIMKQHKIAKIGSSIKEVNDVFNDMSIEYAQQKFGKKANNGLKIANFFKENEQNRKLFDYLKKNPNAPMPIEDKASYGIKDYKDYQNKQKNFKVLYDADALDLVTKY